MAPRLVLALSLLALAVATTTSAPAQPETTELGRAERESLLRSAASGLMEIRLGELALKQASDDNVKGFARMTVRDHPKANDDLKALAGRKQIALPSEPAGYHAKKISEISQKTGTAFDVAYMDLTVKMHKEDVARFREMAEEGKDAEVRAFAKRVLPGIEHHLALAVPLSKKIKGERD
jgi:putative membrane protein